MAALNTSEIVKLIKDELQRLFETSQNIHYELIPVSNATISNLNIDRISEYLKIYRTAIELNDEKGAKYHRNPVLVQYFYDSNIVEKMG